MRIYLKQASIALIFLAATSTELHAGFIPADCANFGVFIANICFLIKDTSEPLVIVADNVGIDGQGHTIFGSGTPEPCLTIDGDNTLVTDLNFEGCDFGAVTFDHNGNRFEDVNCTEVGICNFAINTIDTEIIGGVCDGGGVCDWAIGTTGWTRLDAEYHCSETDTWFGIVTQDGQDTIADGLDFQCDVDSPFDQVNFFAEGQENLQIFNWSQGFSDLGFFGIGNVDVILENFEAEFDDEILGEQVIVQWITHQDSTFITQNHTAIELDVPLEETARIFFGNVFIGVEDVVVNDFKFKSLANPVETAFTAGIVVQDSVNVQIHKADIFGANTSFLFFNTDNVFFSDSKFDLSGGGLFEIGNEINFLDNEITTVFPVLGLDGLPDPFLANGVNFLDITELDVEGNEFEDIFGDGISAVRIFSFSFFDNAIKKVGGSGVTISDSSSGEIVITDISDVSGDGIQLINSDSVLIHSNVIEDVGGAGVTLINADNNQIFENDIEEVGGAGLILMNADNNQIFQNDIKEVFLAGLILINADDNEIFENGFEDCGGPGIQEFGSTGNVFVDNDIEDCPN